MTPHENRLNVTVLMVGHKICFCGEIWLIIRIIPVTPSYLEHCDTEKCSAIHPSGSSSLITVVLETRTLIVQYKEDTI